MFFASPSSGSVIRRPESREECTLQRLRRICAIGAAESRGKKGSFIKRLGTAGFTILELFIVMEIIGFLAVIVMSNFYKSKKAAQVAVTVQNVKHIQTALASYFAMEGKYPATLNTIWLQFYEGRIVENLEYIGGDSAGDQGGWIFTPSNSGDIRFAGINTEQYAIKSKENLLPYANYVYGDAATSAKIVH
jgi:type II secretory pathway pseudopilin PulG